MSNSLIIPQGLQPLSQGQKTRASASVFATLGPSNMVFLVRGGRLEFQRSATEDEVLPGQFRSRLRSVGTRRLLLGRGSVGFLVPRVAAKFAKLTLPDPGLISGIPSGYRSRARLANPPPE